LSGADGDGVVGVGKDVAGGMIDLLADDPTTRRDLVGWCGEFGHRVLGIFELRKGFRVRIQKH
jgi:TusA-related sulfurtransferase